MLHAFTVAIILQPEVTELWASNVTAADPLDFFVLIDRVAKHPTWRRSKGQRDIGVISGSVDPRTPLC